nr:ribosomal protein S16 [Dioscorea banzhuana]WFP44456.1 ribosomal protein S16 [Dioscorea banzhuana]
MVKHRLKRCGRKQESSIKSLQLMFDSQEKRSKRSSKSGFLRSDK